MKTTNRVTDYLDKFCCPNKHCSQFRQARDQRLTALLSRARHRLNNLVLFVPIRIAVDHLCYARIQESNLIIEGGDDFFDALLDGLLSGLLQPVFLLRSHCNPLLSSCNEVVHVPCFLGRNRSDGQTLDLGDAEQDRADEKVCADGSEASGTFDELVPVEGLVEWSGRGF